MKNKIKKIISILLCFILVIGNCLISEAAPSYHFLASIGSQYECSYMANYSSNSVEKESFYEITSLNASMPVYALFLYSHYDTQDQIGLFLFSEEQFNATLDCDSQLADGSFIWKTDTVNVSGNTYTYNGKTFYAKSCTSIIINDALTFSLPCVNYYSSNNNYTEVLYDCLFGSLDTDDFYYLPKSEYADSPTGTIEPPQNLSIYRGYSNADKQYKFQMQWDKPADTNLNVEVMYNIHWKEGTGSALGFGTHVYKKYQHLVYDDGHSAQTNKLQYLEDDLLKAYFESQNMDLPSVYNIDEIYVRFAKEVDGVIRYSLWRKIDYLNLDEGNGFDSTEDDFQAESSTGAFDTSDNWIDQSVQNGEIVNGSDKEDAKAPGLDANGDNITNVTKPIVNPDSWDSEFSNVFDSFTNAIKSALSFVGEFPSMLSEFFGFLPASVIGCISIGLIMVVVLRFLGR